MEEETTKAPLQDNSTSQIVSYTPNEVIVEATMENPGFLVLSDAYHPDWKAYVDGKPSHIFIADCLIRAVYLSSGKHTVRFSFQPRSFYLGIWATGISFLIIGWLLWGRKKKRGV
jgi:uncharacterized membrane protein YfhO